jgi:hypothetical protein
MLHDPSRYEPPPTAEEVILSEKDRDLLRRLATELAAVAALPVHREKARLWQKLNDLQSERPMVWINEICWHEMNVNHELTLQAEHPWARNQEQNLRRTLYQWRHLPGDMILSGYLASPPALESTGFGMAEDADVVRIDAASHIVSRRFKPQINDFADLEKIRMPVVTHNETATECNYQAMCEVFGDILPVRKVGQTHIWFSPWDLLITWWGIEKAMTDLYERPDLVHAAVDRMIDAWFVELEQFEQLSVLALDCSNIRIGSGGYGYTKDLPGVDYDPCRVQPRNMWGFATAQIFSEVSPQMHWEFAIEHELRWLSRWGLNYYGCCEPLDQKIDMLRRIPRLRKISVSPWCKSERAIEEIGADYVISRKPSPAIFSDDDWHPERARQDLRQFLAKTGGKCHVELIMKDISTVRYQPQRLWEWSAIAMETADEFAGG